MPRINSHRSQTRADTLRIYAGGIAQITAMYYNITYLSDKDNERKVPQMDVQVGDKILVKKPHTCQNNEFDVLRVGMDFRIRCTKCGHEIMVPRAKIEKNIKKVIREAER